MIYPTSCRIFKVIDNNRTDARIMLYYNNYCIFSGEIINISSEKFNKLKKFIDELIEINNSEEFSVKFGLIDVQKLMEEFK